MLVIARDLGIKIDRNEAFKGEDGKYYSSEKAWQKEKMKRSIKKGLKEDDNHQKEMRKKCIEKMFDYMGYQSSERMPKPLFGRLKIWHDWGYSYDAIYETLIFCEKAIIRSQNKSFESDINRLFYFLGIIQNSLNDGKRQFEAKQKAIEDARKQDKLIAGESNIEVGVSNRVGKMINLFGGDDDWM